MKKGYWCYSFVVISLAIGYVMGGFLSFGIKYLGALPYITDPSARFILMIFGIGMLGGTTLSSRYWAVDINEVVYENKKKFEPHFFDFVGYLSMIIEGGISGTILYFLVKGGLVVVTSSPDIAISLPATIVIVYCGGLFHFEVIKRLSVIAKDKINSGQA